MKILNIKKFKNIKIKNFKPVKEKCEQCGTKLELTKEDIDKHLVQSSVDGKNYSPLWSKFFCPICSYCQSVSGKNFEKYRKYTFENKIKNKIKTNIGKIMGKEK